MTALTSRMVRSGRSPVITADYQLVLGDGPDVYAHVIRLGRWRGVSWWITAGKDGKTIAVGRTWTRGGAWVKAIAAAHRPGIADGGVR